jgi:hypothetical protein
MVEYKHCNEQECKSDFLAPTRCGESPLCMTTWDSSLPHHVSENEVCRYKFFASSSAKDAELHPDEALLNHIVGKA